MYNFIYCHVLCSQNIITELYKGKIPGRRQEQDFFTKTKTGFVDTDKDRISRQGQDFRTQTMVLKLTGRALQGVYTATQTKTGFLGMNNIYGQRQDFLDKDNIHK